MNEEAPKRLFVKITRESLPQVSTKYPFIYLERGRIEIDDASVKWIDCDCNVVRLPITTISTLLLGPGTSVTHEAVKVMAAANCCVNWVGEDSLLFYAAGQSPTANTRNMLKQVQLALNRKDALTVAKRMFSRRFAETELDDKNMAALRGMEGRRVRTYYARCADQYGIGWKGRSYTPGRFELSDITNQIMTSANAALYGIVLSVVHALGYSPHIGFIHSGSPLPFVYDIADLYKDRLCIDLAFSLTLEMAGTYRKARVAEAFRERVLESALLDKMPDDIKTLLEGL